jgi:hypothetical protein
VIWTNLSLIRREPSLTRFVLMDLRADPGYRKMRIYDLNRRIAAKVMDVVEEGVKVGELRDIPRKLIRDMIFGSIEHQTWAFLRGEGDFSVDDSAAGITDVIYSGIAVQQETRPPEMGDAVARLEQVTAELRAELARLSQPRQA